MTNKSFFRVAFVILSVFSIAFSNAYAEDIYVALNYFDGNTESEQNEIRIIKNADFDEFNGQFIGDPTSVGTVLASNLGAAVTAIEVDIKNQYVYWAECDVEGFNDEVPNGQPSSVKRIPVGGTQAQIEVLLSSEEVCIYDIALDPYNKNRLYFAGPAGHPFARSKIKYINLVGINQTATTWYEHTVPDETGSYLITGLVHNRSVSTNGDSLYYIDRKTEEGSTLYQGFHSLDGLTQGSNSAVVSNINPPQIEDIHSGAFGLAKAESNVPTRLVTTEDETSQQDPGVYLLGYDYTDFQSPAERRNLSDMEFLGDDNYSLVYAFDPISPNGVYFNFAQCEATVLGAFNFSHQVKRYIFLSGSCAAYSLYGDYPSGIAIGRSCGEDSGTLADTDLDGVADCSDLCPFESGEIEKGGCPCQDTSDDDGDGVPACDDVCPNETGEVANSGCICASQVDSDGDGFKDCVDVCPNDAGEAKFAGCPCSDTSDFDVDGLRACDDACPFETGKEEFNGCLCETQLDSDGDTVQNCLDECPFEAGEVVLLGCPCKDFSDSNGDGVRDCEEGLGGAITFNGQTCTSSQNDYDADGDGVTNCSDICPNDPEKATNSDPNICGCNISESLAPSCADECTQGFTDIGCGCGIVDCPTPLGDPLLTPATQLNQPPQVNVKKKKVIIAFKKFSGASLDTSQASSQTFRLAERKKGKNAKQNKLKVRYRVIIRELKKNKARVVKRILTNKTVLRVLKLKNGVYTVRYRAEIKRQKKTVSKTNYSPARTFSIN